MDQRSRVKCIVDQQGYAMYFSRSPLPGNKDGKARAPLPGMEVLSRLKHDMDPDTAKP